MLPLEKWLWGIRFATALAALMVAARGAHKAYFSPTDRGWLMINTFVWTLGPPIWFMLEYCIAYPLLDGNSIHKEDLKYGQDLAKAFWAGIGALLIAIYQMPKPNAEGAPDAHHGTVIASQSAVPEPSDARETSAKSILKSESTPRST